MNKRRIKVVADFLYSSNSSKDVPMRISAISGMGGFDLNKESFIVLMELFENSIDLKKDLNEFWHYHCNHG